MIPKLVHYIWVGPNPYPEDARQRVEDWKRLLPEYRFMLWSEENIDFSPMFVRQAYGVRAYNRVANYARMAALEKFGGIYMDHDVELLKPFDPLLRDACFAGFQTMNPAALDQVNNAVFGAEPGHPFVRRILDAMDAMDGTREVGSGTGPALISRLLREAGTLILRQEPTVVAGVTLYPPRYFYPYSWLEAFDPACVTSDTVAIHRWAHTWKRRDKLVDFLKLKAWRLMTRLSPDLSAAYQRKHSLRKRAAAGSG
jgi:mannosyltransferase OCH1-like enzyme